MTRPSSRGTHTWSAELADGSLVEQFDGDTEYSIDHVPHDSVVAVELQPKEAGHVPIRFETNGSLRWRKCWTVTETFSLDTGAPVGVAVVEHLQLDHVHVFIYANGRVRITTETEP